MGWSGVLGVGVDEGSFYSHNSFCVIDGTQCKGFQVNKGLGKETELALGCWA